MEQEKQSVLLKVENLKKHFPIQRGFFRRVVGHVRAVDGVNFFIREGEVDPERMEIRALADNEPLVPNDSWENRAQNRRVEISVLHGSKLTVEGDSPAENVDYVKQPDGQEQQ